MIFGIDDLYFKPEHADSIVEHCQTNGLSEMETWLHCLSVAGGMCPSKEMTLAAVQMIYDTSEIIGEETIQ
jgi:hypothetical protein|tara:strand:- start:567 stop:779 length:213 start_codon:yes stop_codon:yes gene_type:complete